MITIFNTMKNTTPLTPEQRSELIRCIALYSGTTSGSWLNDVDYDTVEYYWKEDIRNSDVMAIRPLTGNKIILQPEGNNSKIWIQVIAAAAIHELRHVYQKAKLGCVPYCLLAPWGRIPGLNEIAPLEKDAFKHQDLANEWILRNVK